MTPRPRRPARPAARRSAVVPAAPRLAARARAERAGRRRRLARRVLVGLAVVVPAALAGWLLLLSPHLALEQVTVTGTERLSPEQVRAAAAAVTGTPLARIGTDAVADRVAALAPVADVDVRRSWPSTLVLAVVERQPAAGVPVEGGYRLLDADGVAFATEPELPPGVPALDVAEAGPDDPATRAALEVLQALPPPLRDSVAELRAPSRSSVELELSDGRRVIWGAPGDTATKTAAVEALLPMAGTVLDVSAPGVAVRR